MLSAARQAEAAAYVGTAGSNVVADAAQHTMLAAANGVADREAADADNANRPTKRPRAATPARTVTLPPQPSSVWTVSCGQRPTSEAECSAAQAAGVMAAGLQQALAAEQLDGNGCHGVDVNAEWPPDMHDTVGCVFVHANGARCTALTLASQPSWRPGAERPRHGLDRVAQLNA